MGRKSKIPVFEIPETGGPWILYHYTEGHQRFYRQFSRGQCVEKMESLGVSSRAQARAIEPSPDGPVLSYRAHSFAIIEEVQDVYLIHWQSRGCPPIDDIGHEMLIHALVADADQD